MNPMCDNDKCLSANGEVRLLPTGADSNAILCHACFDHELRFRRDRSAHGNSTLAHANALPSPWTANQPRNLNSRNEMKLTLTIDMDNAAFEDAQHIESARILRVAADKIEAGEIGEEAGLDGRLALMDINGNKVGQLKVS